MLRMISGLYREVDEIWVLLGSYVSYSGNSLPTFRNNLSNLQGPRNPNDHIGFFWPLKMKSMSCSETSLGVYQYTLRNIPDEHRSQRYFDLWCAFHRTPRDSLTTNVWVNNAAVVICGYYFRLIKALVRHVVVFIQSHFSKFTRSRLSAFRVHSLFFFFRVRFFFVISVIITHKYLFAIRTEALYRNVRFFPWITFDGLETEANQIACYDFSSK